MASHGPCPYRGLEILRSWPRQDWSGWFSWLDHMVGIGGYLMVPILRSYFPVIRYDTFTLQQLNVCEIPWVCSWFSKNNCHGFLLPAPSRPALQRVSALRFPLYGFHDDDFSTRLQAAALVGLMLTLDDLNLPGLIEIFMDFYGFVTGYCVANPPINQRRVISPRFMILGYL